jgi:hypothetical protein
LKGPAVSPKITIKICGTNGCIVTVAKWCRPIEKNRDQPVGLSARAASCDLAHLRLSENDLAHLRLSEKQ